MNSKDISDISSWIGSKGKIPQEWNENNAKKRKNVKNDRKENLIFMPKLFNLRKTEKSVKKKKKKLKIKSGKFKKEKVFQSDDL